MASAYNVNEPKMDSTLSAFGAKSGLLKLPTAAAWRFVMRESYALVIYFLCLR